MAATTASTSEMARQNVGANASGTGNTAKKPDANYRGFVAGIFSGIAKLSGMSLVCGLGLVGPG